MADPTTPNNSNQEPPTATSPSAGVDRQVLSELATAMQDLRQSVDTNTTTVLTKPVINPIPVTNYSETPADIDFTDPVAVKKYIQDEMVKAKNEANKAYVADQARRMYDQLIDQDFPELQQTSSALYKETIKEVRKRMNMEGIASLDEMRQRTPSIFYDAAAAASVRLQHTNKTKNLEYQRLSGLTGGFVEGGITPPSPPPVKTGVTPEQRYFAEKFGLDTGKMKEVKYEKGSDGTYRLVR